MTQRDNKKGNKRGAKKDEKIVMTRRLIIGFFGLVAIALVGFGTYLSSGLQDSGEATASDDYTLIENGPPRRLGERIEIVEFFSYRCRACKNFEPLLEDWRDELAEDVRFSRKHVVFSPIDELYRKTYLALDATDSVEQNHSRIFTALQNQGRQLTTPDAIAEFVDGRGVEKDDFLHQLNSARVNRLARRADAEQRTFAITGTPTLIVAGRYRVDMDNGQRRALVVASQLIERERSSDTPGP